MDRTLSGFRPLQRLSDLADLATEYSVGRSTIHRIIHGSPDSLSS
jgi:hypothetical protein